MDDETGGWWTLPPALRLGIGLVVIQTVVMTICDAAFAGRYGPPGWLSIAGLGAEVARNALCAYGAADLAQRHRGWQRRGLQIASAGWLAAFVLRFVWLGASIMLWSPESPHGELWIAASQYSWFAVELLPVVGLATAAARRHRALALVSVVIAGVSHPPPFAARAIWGWLALGNQGTQLCDASLALLGVALIAALARTLAPATTISEPEGAAVGLRRAATGLRIRMIAVIVGTGTELVALTSHGRDASGLYQLMLIAGPALHAAAFGWFAFGLLGVAHRGQLARDKLVFAGATTLWCGAVMLVQLVFQYAGTYGSSDIGPRAFGEEVVPWVPVVALLGVAIFAKEIGSLLFRHRQEQILEDEGIGAFVGLAARGRKDQLQRDATGHLVWIILLMLASIVIQGWGLPHNDWRGRDHAVLRMVLSAGCSLVALTLTRWLCRKAAAVFEHTPGMPVARIVGPG